MRHGVAGLSPRSLRTITTVPSDSCHEAFGQFARSRRTITTEYPDKMSERMKENPDKKFGVSQVSVRCRLLRSVAET